MKKILLLSLFCLGMLLPLSDAFAQCVDVGVNDEWHTHDHEFSSVWGCDREQYLEMWKRFHFDKQDWDDGFGFYNVCDDRRPLKRTFNALFLLKYAGTSAPTCSTSDNNMLKWIYCWTGNAIDELDGACRKPGVLATTWFGWFVDDRTELYYDFFYGYSPVERASTLVHEARHAQGHCSHKSCGCPRGASCDPTYFDGCRGFGSSSGLGANGYQIVYLEWLATNSRWTTSWMKSQAVSKARAVLEQGFCTPPCFSIDFLGYPHFTCSQ